MIEYITEEDLDLINLTLASGADVKIKTTKEGVIIIRESFAILRKRDRDGNIIK